MRVTTEKIVFGGKALARIDGKTIFIPFALPDEELDITVTANKRDYSEAVIKKIITPSPHRIEPACPYFGHCGGCNLQMADNDFQQVLRQAMVAELFDRAHITPERPPVFITGPAWEYRNRFQFHTDKNGTIGMHGFASNTVVPVHDCPIATPALRTILQQGGLQKLFPRSTKIAQDRYHIFAQDDVYSPVHPDASARVKDTVLNFSVFGFFQSNITMLEKLIEPVSDIPPCTRILDFYAGVGTFSAFLTDKASELHLVEHNERALRTAQQNLNRIIAEKNSPCRGFFHAVSDADWPDIPAAQLTYNAAIIDPPRQGIHERALTYLGQAKIPRIHYVSCNPATFVRDAKKLTALGYRFIEYHLFDFYPQTHHCELLGIFIR
ncbi:class I SAM-dependent RNA methyltransferase [Treponema sp. OMZ 855]|uniref:class I SAM-dependent RNA methyltransferase n=1 Tax=Treponema sp. OMZ 855 TaxID=1643512 RepID=UPI0020A239A6|nr:TRAM domain-containing protein [Treponema sp. OMZ 855]UTC50709.1 class I SAM-dependent RNA methyltransferase [Treponema sp. OMZ 855]